MSKKEDCIVMDGTVIKDRSNSVFDVELDNGVVVRATLAGKIRMNNIRVQISDRVKCELSPYDLTICRISYRYKPERKRNDD